METIRQISARLGKNHNTVRSWAYKATELNPVIDEKIHAGKYGTPAEFTPEEVMEIESFSS